MEQKVQNKNKKFIDSLLKNIHFFKIISLYHYHYYFHIT